MKEKEEKRLAQTLLRRTIIRLKRWPELYEDSDLVRGVLLKLKPFITTSNQISLIMQQCRKLDKTALMLPVEDLKKLFPCIENPPKNSAAPQTGKLVYSQSLELYQIVFDDGSFKLLMSGDSFLVKNGDNWVQARLRWNDGEQAWYIEGAEDISQCLEVRI